MKTSSKQPEPKPLADHSLDAAAGGITLYDCLISGVVAGPAGGDDMPTESLSLSQRKPLR